MMDNLGHRSEIRVITLLKRMSKYMSESFWNSIYSKMHRVMLLNTARADEFGIQASTIMNQNLSGIDTVELIMVKALHILGMELSRRSADDHSFLMGLMRHKNHFRTKLCAGWAEYQITELCKKLRFANVKSMRKVSTMVLCWFMLLCVCMYVCVLIFVVCCYSFNTFYNVLKYLYYSTSLYITLFLL